MPLGAALLLWPIGRHFQFHRLKAIKHVVHVSDCHGSAWSSKLPARQGMVRTARDLELTASGTWHLNSGMPAPGICRP